MKTSFSILAFVVLSLPGASWAQIAAPNSMGVAMGHVHLNVRDIQAEKKFWLMLGGVEGNHLSANEPIRFPGGLILIRKQKDPPTGGSVGSVVDHIGFHVPDIQAASAKWTAAGIKVDPGANGRKDQAFITTADGLKVEFLEDKSMTVPIAMHHIHFYVTEDQLQAIRSYYVDVYGATPGHRDPYDTANLPGIELTFAKAPAKTAPTRGRVLDHIGFEVTNLEDFTKKQKAAGRKLDREFRKQESFGISVMTDPWGATTELTEGERQY